MSHVTNYVIFPPFSENQRLDEFNEYLHNKLEPLIFGNFKDVGRYAGGTKYLEADVWALAVNHGPPAKDMTELFQEFSWECADELVVLYLEQEDFVRTIACCDPQHFLQKNESWRTGEDSNPRPPDS